tara:strand:+ start:239 stop:673 length:435 start_codon:yes stop_codon:yes gene_type:complete
MNSRNRPLTTNNAWNILQNEKAAIKSNSSRTTSSASNNSRTSSSSSPINYNFSRKHPCKKLETQYNISLAHLQRIHAIIPKLDNFLSKKSNNFNNNSKVFLVKTLSELENIVKATPKLNNNQLRQLRQRINNYLGLKLRIPPPN